MRIEHVAIWCKNLEEMKHFYTHFFNAKSNDKYENPSKGFRSYFLTLPDGPRIELMQMDSVLISAADVFPQLTGLAHIAFAVGSEAKVDAMAANFRANGYEVLDGPRRTGDGYYECVVLDPEWNRVEIIV
ncbi:VOC family protein [Moritella sp. Urea-trap-13]|uniref:VOC family protein n=1 Tax=Moritella sp. Urea-trap-13 TaxID=2058327 RepID=UPI000C33F447|nr:VOC family protein [Moritella sp. Urea-trap-13]PKH07855.1 glyoxalase [Moritella sp. Urea-trap-13]